MLSSNFAAKESKCSVIGTIVVTQPELETSLQGKILFETVKILWDLEDDLPF